jgi:pentose-5-phosphate-3-epimerase
VKVFLDDERVPVNDGWTVIRRVDDFKKIISVRHHLIEQISFDHDLADPHDRDGTYCIHLMVEQKLDDPMAFANLKKIMLHTANYEGLKNMMGLLQSAKKNGLFKGVSLQEYSCLYHTDHAVMPDNFERDENE